MNQQVAGYEETNPARKQYECLLPKKYAQQCWKNLEGLEFRTLINPWHSGSVSFIVPLIYETCFETG
jgi:hypothetical protein